MEDIAIALRTLWRHRQILLIGALVAVLCGAFAAYRLPTLQSRSFQVAVASEEVLVDTPTTQVVKVGPAGVDTLGPTATLLADVMTQGSVKQAIAQRSGLAFQNLSATPLSGSSVAGQPPALPPSDSFVRQAGTGIITTQTLMNAVNSAIPIIRIEARAADPATAKRLAGAAVTALRSYVVASAAADQVPAKQRLRIVGLGPAQETAETSGMGPIFAVGATIAVFLAVCVSILLATAIRRGWRRAAALELEERSPESDEAPLAPADFFSEPRDANLSHNGAHHMENVGTSDAVAS